MSTGTNTTTTATKKRKRKRSRGGTLNNPLLLKLAEACAQHKQSHLKDDTEGDDDNHNHHHHHPNGNNDDDGDSPSDRCRQDLHAMRRILLRVEGQYERERGEESTDSTNGGDGGGERFQDIENLCMLYRSIAADVFCPYSMKLLFQDGKEGIEILPRVHLLLSHLSSDVVLQSTLSSSPSPSPSTKSQQKEVNTLETRANLISCTAAELMCKIPERTVFESCVKDIITLLFDLSVVASSGAFTSTTSIAASTTTATTNDNDNDKPEQQEQNEEDASIHLMIFTETCREWDTHIDTDFTLKLNSLNSVRSIQSGVLHMLFLLLVMRQYGSPLEEDHNKINGLNNGPLLCVTPLPCLASFIMIGESQSSFLSCINQILQETVDPNMGDSDNLRFMLENKLMASNLFLLLLPDLSAYTEQYQAATRVTWTELIQITAGACKAHFLFLSTNDNDPNKSNKGMDDLTASLSFSLSMLMRNICFSPPTPFQPSVYELWVMRKGVLDTFLDCIPLMSKVSSLSGNCCLCHNVIYTLYISLNTEVDSVSQGFFKMELDELRYRVYTTCSLENIFPSLFELLSVDSFRLVVAHLIAILSIGEMDWGLFNYLCQDSMLPQTQESNNRKRRRISQTSPSNTGTSAGKGDRVESEHLLNRKEICRDKEHGRMNLDNSFVQVFTSFFKRSLICAQTLLHHSANPSIKQYEIDNLFPGLEVVQMAKNIASSICLIEFIFENYFDEKRVVLNGLYSLYKGIQVISNVTASASSASCTVSSNSKSAYKDLLIVIIGVFEKCAGNKIGFEKTDDVRHQEMLLALCHCALKVCLPSSQFIEFTKICELEICKGRHSELPIFDGCATRMLHEADLDCLIHTMSSRLLPCSELCSALQSFFDKPSYINYHMLHFPYESRLGVQEFTTGKMLLQQILSLNQRCVLMAFLYPIWDKSHDEYASTSSMLINIPSHSTPSYFEAMGTLIAVFPILMISSLQTNNHSNEDDHRCAGLLKYPGGLLGCIKAQTRTPFMTDSNSHSNISTMSLECLSRILDIFSCSKFPACPSVDDGDYSEHFKTGAYEVSILPYLFGFPREPQIESMSSVSKASGLSILRPYIVEILKEMNDETSLMIGSEIVRKVKWNFIRSACSILDYTTLLQFASLPQGERMIERSRNPSDIDAPRETRLPLLLWMFQLPIMDPDDDNRRYTSERIGRTILQDDCKVLNILFSDESAQNTKDTPQNHLASVEKLYEKVDQLLYKYCGASQSELSCTVGLTHTGSSILTSETSSSAVMRNISRQISAIKVLYSLCHNAKRIPVPAVGDSIFEKGLIRIIRFWILGSPLMVNSFRASSAFDTSIVAFQMIQNLHQAGEFGVDMSDHLKKSLLPGLFCEILCHIPFDSIIKDSQAEKKYHLLIELIETFLMPKVLAPNKGYFRFKNENEVSRRTLAYVQKVLPLVITATVIEQDYETLCQCTGFYHFLVARAKTKKEKIQYDGFSAVQKEEKRSRKMKTMTDLKRETSKLCSTDDDKLKVMRILLPRLLMEPNKAPLLFYLRKVNDSCASLREILLDKEVMIVREIIWEVGRMAYTDECNDEGFDTTKKIPSVGHDNASRALQKAALVLMGKKGRCQSEEGGSFQSLEGLESLDLEFSQKAAENSVEDLVQKHFMMLLVNNVTMRWKKGEIGDKIQALKCLRVLLRFLKSPDSSLYITQILNMVDTAINFENQTHSASTLSKVHFFAVKSLGEFVHILLSSDWKIVAENLSKIIVSLFPLLEPQSRSNDITSLYRNQAVEEAAKILESFVEGRNGERFAPYFKNIPFLPKHSLLNDVRKCLKAYGINFDSLLLLNSESSVDDASGTPGLDSTPSICSNETSTKDTMKVAVAFRSRLQSLKNLFHHESENVRREVYLQLRTLIRGHRELFQRMIESGDASMRFLTVSKDKAEDDKGENTSATNIVLNILRRFKLESNDENVLILSRCLGEIGAIAPNFIGEDTFHSGKELVDISSSNWMLEHGAPWKFKSVKVHFELQLVTNNFVIALKAAPTPIDVHLIAFAVQEVLKLLDSDTRKNTSRSRQETADCDANEEKKPEMNKWLRDKLEKAGVINIVEPYWSTLYREKETSKTKQPPFFERSECCYIWLANWTRFMIERSHKNDHSRYKDIFFACRTTMRSEAGMGIIKFLLPLLVLDSICFGDEYDRKTTVGELKAALFFGSERIPKMEKVELQKAVAIVFLIIETLQLWAETEIEERYKAQKKSAKAAVMGRKGGSSKAESVEESSEWPSDASVAGIEELLKAISLETCAKAAFKVGMFAQALRFLEVDARKKGVDEVYDVFIQNGDNSETHFTKNRAVGTSHLKGMNINLAHRLFGELQDCDSMTAIAKACDKQNLTEQIRERALSGDWHGVSQKCEQALQIETTAEQKSFHLSDTESESANIRKYHLKALLELGQLESAFNQMNGIISLAKKELLKEEQQADYDIIQKNDHERNYVLPFFAEASWRLSRWDSLIQTCVDPVSTKGLLTKMNGNDSFSIAVGKTMLGLHEKDFKSVRCSLEEAHRAITPALTVASRENYTRAYPSLLQLHCLREIEDACDLLSSSEGGALSSVLDSKWHWTSRLKGVDNVSASMNIINIRLALSRIAVEPVVEAELWLTAGKRARKGGLLHISENALSHADAVCQKVINERDFKDEQLHLFLSEVKLQVAKLKYSSGHLSEAVQIIDDENVLDLLNKSGQPLENYMKKIREEGRLRLFSRSTLQATEWMVEGGTRSGSEIMARYRLLLKVSPEWERAHFRFAKYLDSILESRILVLTGDNIRISDDEAMRSAAIQKDQSSQKYFLEALKEYGEALRLGLKHVFQALPRFLTLWFEFTGIPVTEKSPEGFSTNQDAANEIVAKYIRSIPSVAYYSVLPQLISRVGHTDEDTVTVVSAILKRVLSKFPGQAMWSLAWLRHSIHRDRQKKADEIFKGAQKILLRTKNKKMHDVLEDSKSLFKFLIDLAKYQPKRQDARTINVHQWKGTIELKEFVPPVQAALTLSRNAVGTVGDRQEAFPSCVPRMRTFSNEVHVMASKARPKKISAFAIPEGATCISRDTKGASRAQPEDIGEMHFLLKQEAKGDLRKDARVQDLNNVINRLFTSSTVKGSKSQRNHRRLRLRTFSVVCLSEDCGILEWVPNTESFRNLVGKAYHPYAAHHSVKRRGKRITNFGDVTLRGNFMQAQEEYIKNGKLTNAAKMFDQLCLKEFPPLFYWWFISQFKDPHKWFVARTNFAQSAAAWSGVGHVIGLGDRHSENILLDTTNGECVHVDFDCIFDKGLHLPRPEVIPFRLTPNMLDAFGPIGCHGGYTGGLTATMSTLRENRDLLLSVLEPFLKDPVIDWKRHRSQQKGKGGSKPANFEAKRSIKVIDERLKGIYNLRNPNARKVRRVDGHSINEDDEMARLIPLSVEGQVHKMITEATSHENLVQVYVGWMPWL